MTPAISAVGAGVRDCGTAREFLDLPRRVTAGGSKIIVEPWLMIDSQTAKALG
jgi:hypothetical protein